jgi:hypothetical protein
LAVIHVIIGVFFLFSGGWTAVFGMALTGAVVVLAAGAEQRWVLKGFLIEKMDFGGVFAFLGRKNGAIRR